MSYTVSVIWFQSYDRRSHIPAHWSIFVQETDSTTKKGTKHDAMGSGQGRWRYESFPQYIVDQSVDYGEHKLIGKIVGNGNLSSFYALLSRTALPGTGENCQNWVWNVIEGAVKAGYLDKSALAELAKVQVYGA